MAKVAKNKKYDYQTLGLKCGLELHQQLNTGRKLFCHCKTELQTDAPSANITRHMRPTLSEMGSYDKAALMEFKKRKKIIYEIHPTICTYELDETPPFEPDVNAIDLAVTIAKLLEMEIVDELHVNRKQYLDGSIPTGFQRTMIVGIGGKIKSEGKTVNLDMLALEEDSCREIASAGRKIVWRVDRLGTPLVEIATKTINISDPDEIKMIAEKIGRILRATGQVKRGLGTIRQDLNISIEKGARIEIKGVQILAMLPLYVELEVERQLALISIKDEMLKLKLTEKDFEGTSLNCKDVFQKTKSKLILEAMKGKNEILGLRLPKMNGILGRIVQKNHTFGKEIADRVKIIAGLGGVIHTDELPNYGITKEEVNSLRELFSCENNDAVVFVIGGQEDAKQAIAEIKIRIKEALKGVPEETRHAIDDGTTSFRRYLGGAGRMYPDTDSYPIVLTEGRINRIVENLPELPEAKEERFLKEYKLPEELSKSLAISPKVDVFEELVEMSIDPILAAVTLEQTLKSLEREELQVELIADKKIIETFELLKKGKIAKEAIEEILRYLANNPKEKLEAILKKLKLETISEKELELIIDKLIETNLSTIKETGKRAKGMLMGSVMEEVRGKIDGKIVNEKIEQKLNEKLKELAIE